MAIEGANDWDVKLKAELDSRVLKVDHSFTEEQFKRELEQFIATVCRWGEKSPEKVIEAIKRYLREFAKANYAGYDEDNVDPTHPISVAFNAYQNEDSFIEACANLYYINDPTEYSTIENSFKKNLSNFYNKDYLEALKVGQQDALLSVDALKATYENSKDMNAVVEHMAQRYYELTKENQAKLLAIAAAFLEGIIKDSKDLDSVQKSLQQFDVVKKTKGLDAPMDVELALFNSKIQGFINERKNILAAIPVSTSDGDEQSSVGYDELDSGDDEVEVYLDPDYPRRATGEFKEEVLKYIKLVETGIEDKEVEYLAYSIKELIKDATNSPDAYAEFQKEVEPIYIAFKQVDDQVKRMKAENENIKKRAIQRELKQTQNANRGFFARFLDNTIFRGRVAADALRMQKEVEDEKQLVAKQKTALGDLVERLRQAAPSQVTNAQVEVTTPTPAPAPVQGVTPQATKKVGAQDLLDKYKKVGAQDLLDKYKDGIPPSVPPQVEGDEEDPEVVPQRLRGKVSLQQLVEERKTQLDKEQKIDEDGDELDPEEIVIPLRGIDPVTASKDDDYDIEDDINEEQESEELDQNESEEMMVDLQSVLNDLDSYRNNEERFPQLIKELYDIFNEGIETHHAQLVDTVKFYLRDTKNSQVLSAFNNYAVEQDRAKRREHEPFTPLQKREVEKQQEAIIEPKKNLTADQTTDSEGDDENIHEHDHPKH